MEQFEEIINNFSRALSTFSTGRMGRESKNHRALRTAAELLAESLKELEAASKNPALDQAAIWDKIGQLSLTVKALARNFKEEKEKSRNADTPAAKQQLEGADAIYNLASRLNEEYNLRYPEGKFASLDAENILNETRSRGRKSKKKEGNQSYDKLQEEYAAEFMAYVEGNRIDLLKAMDAAAKAIAAREAFLQSPQPEDAMDVPMDAVNIAARAEQIKGEPDFQHVLWQIHDLGNAELENAKTVDLKKEGNSKDLAANFGATMHNMYKKASELSMEEKTKSVREIGHQLQAATQKERAKDEIINALTPSVLSKKTNLTQLMSEENMLAKKHPDISNPRKERAKKMVEEKRANRNTKKMPIVPQKPTMFGPNM